ncbi:cytochrome P460 family protein [Roseibium album]|uniref:cytochrome P460 family protein n=1 Tax=Roseibium album TaxID=311410 RepID=UPI00329A1FEB
MNSICKILFALFIFLLPARSIGADPIYNKKGQWILPQGYETWVFVGSNLGLGYVGEPSTPPPKFRNVYMETEAYETFMITGEFPEPTQFLFEVYSAKDRVEDGEINAGVYNSELLSVVGSVKDSRRPIRNASKENWAYYVFPVHEGQVAEAATARPDSQCWSCHNEHAGYDKVWVQLYPRLRERLEKY